MGSNSELPGPEALMDALPGPVLLLDLASHSLQVWNARAEEVYGPLEAGGATCCALIGTESPPCREGQGACPLAAAGARGVPAEAVLPPGEGAASGAVRIRGVPIRDVSGAVRWLAELHEEAGEGHPEELEGGDARYRLFFEEGPLGMAITQPDKAWEYVNQGLCTMLGYSEHELRAMTWAELTHPEDLPADLEQFERIFQGEIDGYELEKRFLCKDGSALPIRMLVRCERGADGAPWRFLALIEDISEQREAEQQLRESELRYRTLFEQIPDAVFIFDRQGLREANSGAVELFGCTSKEELLTCHPADLSPATQPDGSDSRALAEQRIGETFRQGAHRFEWLHRRRDTGAEFTVEVTLNRLDLQGEAVIQAVVRDITERKRMENELRSALSLNRAVQDSIANGILVVDREGQVITTNAQFAEMWGIPEDFLAIGDDDRLLDYVLKHLKDPDGFLGSVKAIYDDPHAVSQDWIEFKDGRVFERFSQPLVLDGEPRGRVWSFLDITERKLAEDRMAYMAYHDLLTGLPNRRGLQEALQEGLQRGRGSGERLGVIFLDLEDFKDINDNLGHSWGDSLLIAVAERLRTLVQSQDTVARFGGDEFAILMEGLAEPEQGTALAERVIEHLTRPFEIGGQRLSVNTSLGISLFPEDGETGEDLLAKADAAMYRAKEEGRNTYRFFTRELSVQGQSRLVWKQQLRDALDSDQLVLYYQPQVVLGEGTLVGLEALVRWQHPYEGLLGPNRFIPLAEESGLIVPLGEWVLREACHQGAAWLAEGREFGRIAVNIGADHIKRGNLPQRVAEILAETGLAGQRLEVEITEASLLDRPQECAEQLHALHALGLRITIDDFGTGYSSLAYLKAFPIDRIKIDKGFVADLPDDANDAALVRAIIALGKALGLVVLGEGVETEAQRRFLQGEGCELGQGFLWARPGPKPRTPRAGATRRRRHAPARG